MPQLAAFLRSLFQGQLSFMTSMFDRRVALRLAWVSFAVSLLVAMYAAVNAILSGLSYAMPSAIAIGASWVMPDNFDECITAYFGTHIALYAFEWKMRISSKLAY